MVGMSLLSDTVVTLLKRRLFVVAPHNWASNAVNEQCKLG